MPTSVHQKKFILTVEDMQQSETCRRDEQERSVYKPIGPVLTHYVS